MKNFRKVLALVLVVATLFSFVAMASAKTLEDYSDANEVKFEEAVDVLSALGIINGYTDGTFKPESNIEREEMAKMVAVLSNASDFDATMYASANKFADAKGTWAEGYIAYCAQTGIVAGRNATTFDPEGLVTGVEVLKMLLCTLGYDAKEQGYVGANWQVNVLRDARKSDLLAGLNGVDLYAASTRDEAAQMFLNALKANMVYGYLSENIVKVSNSLYFAADNFISLPDAQQKGYELAYCNAILSNVPLYTIFGVKMYDTDRLDCFGRPCTLWVITNKYGAVILQKSYAAVADFTFTDDVKLEVELGDIFGSKNQPQNVLNGSVTVFVDGVKQQISTLVDASEVTGNGALTEVYIDGVDVIVVVINTYIGTVTARGKMPATVTVDGKYTFANKIGLKVDDVVLYNRCVGPNGYDELALDVKEADWYVHDVKLALPTVETVIHASESVKTGTEKMEDSYFQTAGQKFEYAANYANKLWDATYAADNTYMDILGKYDVVPELNEYDVYVNEFGYVMAVLPHEDETEWQVAYFVEDTQDSTGAGVVVNGETVREYAMDIVEFDGMAGTKTATVDVAIERDTWEDTGVTNGGWFDDPLNFGTKDYIGMMGRYEVNKYGEVEVSEWATVADLDSYLVAGSSFIYGEDGVRTNLETQFMVRTYNWATQTYTYTVYVGYNNLPGVLFGSKPLNNGIVDAPQTYNSIQYLFGAEDAKDYDPCIATHVFVDAFFAGVNEYFYLLKPVSTDAETALYPWLASYIVYSALIDGQKAYVALTEVDGIGVVQQVNHGLYMADLQVIDGATINGLPIYVLADQRNQPEQMPWKIVAAPSNGLITISYIEGAADMGHRQISPDAAIHVVYNAWDEILGWDDELSYTTFSGATRDADFDEFFEVNDWDWDSMTIYTSTEEVGDGYWTEATQITEMWIQLNPGV